VKNRSFHISAEVDLPTEKEQGVLVTQGGLSGGYALLMKDGRLSFHYNKLDIAHFDITAPDVLAPGKHTIEFDFTYDGGGFGKGGEGTLRVDGRPVARGRIESTIPIRISLDETFDIGEDTGTPINLTYDVPHRFTGRLGKVVFHLEEAAVSFDDLLKILREQKKLND